MQKETNISFKLFPFFMAVLMLFVIGVETTYAMNMDATQVIENASDQEEQDQQRSMVDILKDQHDALPHSSEKMHWCNVFIKTAPKKENFRFIVPPVCNDQTTTNYYTSSISIQEECIFTYYSAPNAP
ncbi:MULTISPECIES: hypothetical protein [Flammeovirga]|uniref:Uncharacterized protein n=1 Tax=Flammeovirga agarivorans TaxID=2726742 RepID=A0A7X8SIP9_9BACT|nr:MULTISPECIES: hypothetical protein [Flammeovirga]NLR90971.1 hypothetical protein [Flammeovirga agarivorans]